MIVIGHVSGAVLEQVEAHQLLDLAAAPLVEIADVAELVDQLGVDARLLTHLARGRGLGSLVSVRMALGKSEHAVAGGVAFDRHDHHDVVPAHDDAPR